jgi:serine/threonine-protein kinase
MGRVFRAENMLTGKQVALKCLHAHITAGSDASERLLREARAVSSLTHSNVVDVYDVVRDGDTLFLVMELLKGETLRAYLLRNPHPKISEFVALMLPAMSGVEAAHQCGVIHRDLKPENIFLAQVGGQRQAVIKVLDFGIAKLAAARGATLTRTGAALGTPLYMSLEQLRGDKDVDQRADVYAFGVMLYEAVTGLMPYEAETLPELAIKVATTDAPPVKSLRPDVPTTLARIIDWAVARDRNQRLPDLQTLQHELEVFAHDRSFREQMTERAAPLPRLAAERPDETAATTPASRVPPRSAAAQSEAKSMLRPEADTLRAKEVARSRSAKPSLLRSRWVVGGALLASALVAGSLWFQSQAKQEAESAASSSPTITETSAEVSAPASGPAAPALKVEPAGLPKPLSAPGASDVALQPAAASASPPPAAKQSDAPSKVNEASAMKSELPSEKLPVKPAPAAVHDTRPKVRAPAPVIAPAHVIINSVEKTPVAVPPAPAKKTPRDLVGF